MGNVGLALYEAQLCPDKWMQVQRREGSFGYQIAGRAHPALLPPQTGVSAATCPVIATTCQMLLSSRQSLQLYNNVIRRSHQLLLLNLGKTFLFFTFIHLRETSKQSVCRQNAEAQRSASPTCGCCPPSRLCCRGRVPSRLSLAWKTQTPQTFWAFPAWSGYFLLAPHQGT